MEQYIVERAKISDSLFLGQACRDAERAHTGTGIWDVLGGSNNVDMVAALEHVVLHDTASHVHISRFFVVRDTSTGLPVASACGFLYPNCSISNSKPGLNNALKLQNGWSDEDVESAWVRLKFLDECFPDFEYNYSWMVEAVYTSPEHRGKGLALKVINAVLEEGRKLSAADKAASCNKSLITCALGNEAAKKVYEKLGYQVVGQGSCGECQAALGSAGFYLLCQYF